MTLPASVPRGDRVEAALRRTFDLWATFEPRVAGIEVALADDPQRFAFEAGAAAPLGPLDAQRVLEAPHDPRPARAPRRIARRRNRGARGPPPRRAACRDGRCRCAGRGSRGGGLVPPALGTLAPMSDNTVDGAQARQRLESERARVSGMIESLRDEIGDTPEADQLGELAAYDQHPADQGSETFEREKDLSILEAPRDGSRRDRGRDATRRRRHLRHRRGHRRADRPGAPRRGPDRAHERRDRPAGTRGSGPPTRAHGAGPTAPLRPCA